MTTRPLTVSMSAREASAMGRPFAPRGEPIHDAGVALDEVLSLRAGPEPVVLRVAAAGGSPAQREALVRDWLCEPGEEPVGVAEPSWGRNDSAREWSSKRRWVEAWEGCRDARWMMHAAADVGADRASVVLAACACVRRGLGLVPRAAEREACEAIVRRMEALARRGATEREANQIEADVLSARESVDGLGRDAWSLTGALAATAGMLSPSPWPTTSAKWSASDAVSMSVPNDADRADAVEALSDVVRLHVPTVAVLRAAARQFEADRAARAAAGRKARR